MRFRSKTEKKEKRGTSPRTIFIWASLLTAIAGFIFLFEPLEDIYRGGRNMLRMHPADQSIVVVGIDNNTIERLGGTSFSRANDARLVDTLFRLGARRVYFDRAFADPREPEGDIAFEQALGRYRGRAFLGAFVSYDPLSGTNQAVLPFTELRNSAEMRALGSEIKPFALSSELFYSMVIDGTDIRSVSSDIAQVKGPANVPFRPDWSIDVKSIPTIGYVDVLDGKIGSGAIAGKDLIIAQTTVQGKDITQVVGHGWFPAVYAHVVAAQTLRNGTPRNIGWIPAWLIAAALSALMLTAKSRRTIILVWVGAFTAAVAVPFLLDMNLVTADFVPAYLLFGIVAYRVGAQRSLARASRRNAGTLMPNLSALREEPAAGSRPIIAMRIRNYAAVCASFAEAIDDELFIELARRLSLPGGSSTFYQAEDVLYWLGPALTKGELEDHLEGLARLIESQFVIQNRKIDIHVAFGVDNDQARSVVSRIGRALLAADTAAARHQLMAFSTWDDDEDAAWELSLMSELDAAIDARDIWVAYQPQFDIKTNAISGVEALVRWQHPSRGAISPEAFIGPAESHNRMLRLTLDILNQASIACRPIIAKNPNFRLSVNLSASLLEHPHLPEKVTEILGATGFPTKSLTLEVTESAPFAEHQSVTRNLQALAELGIDLSIDDYGTGNATLEYLRTVPCQEIKIDRRFVAGLTGNNSDRLLVESTIELAHGLGRRVIAEGIEDAETLRQLRVIGCDIAQGYFLAKPMRIEALLELVGSSSAHIVAA